jgi:SNF2 family DNA or RNA helicase
MKPRPYQEEAADFLYSHDRAMILAAVGAGKTMITLLAMDAMIRDGVARRWLVLAPKRVCTDVWPVEAPKWAPGLTLAVAVGTPAQRAAAFASKANVVVANYDTIQTLPSLDGFDGVVFDELTRLKNPSGARFKDLFKKLDPLRFRWGLTGSFTSNGLEDVFGQCKVIDVDLLGRSKGAFLQTWFIPISREFGQWVARPSALAGIMAKIKPATFVLDAGEYSDKLPPLNVVEVRSTMDMKAYDKMKRDYVAQVGTETVTALTAAAVTSKLQQLAGGWAYTGGAGSAAGGHWHAHPKDPSLTATGASWFSSHRFDRLEELLAENQRANTLVVYNYREELAELKRRYPQAQTLDDADALARWNAGKIEMLLVHPKSAGHGINAQFGGSHIVFVSLPWSLELFEQTVGRLHRSGQKHPVYCYVMMTEKTIDERIWQSLHDKRSLSQLATEELAA